MFQWIKNLFSRKRVRFVFSDGSEFVCPDGTSKIQIELDGGGGSGGVLK